MTASGRAVYVRSGCYQQIDDRHIAQCCRIMQRHKVFLIANVRICPMVQQHFYDVRRIIPAGVEQRRAACFIPPVYVCTAAFQNHLHSPLLVIFAGLHQGIVRLHQFQSPGISSFRRNILRSPSFVIPELIVRTCL